MTVNDKKMMIIEKAALLFSRKGFYGAGLNELLTACNVALPETADNLPKKSSSLSALNKRASSS